MRVGRWFLPALFLVLVAAVVLIPATEPGREWLLQRVVAALEDSGYDLSYREAQGNPWLGVELSGARVRGPGLDLRLASLELDYFLPSLLTGELPVSLGLAGVRGEVDLDSLALSGGSRENSSVSLELRELNVSDVAVEFAGVPWTLPALSIEDVTVARKQDSIEFEARLRSNQGQAQLAGTVQLEPWRMDVEVLNADARLARQWWDGVQAGTVQGRLVADAEGAVADLTIADGAVSYLGATVADIGGPLSYDHGLVKAALQGRGLGGPVDADISVDTSAQGWRARLQGTPELFELASWLSNETVDPEALALEGVAQVEVEASGWSAVHLEGVASGAGSILRQPLDDLEARFEFESAIGTTLNATGSVAGGPLSLELRPERDGMILQLAVESAELLPGLLASFDVTTNHLPEGVTGQARGRLEGRLAGRSLTVNSDALLDEDGLQLFSSGSDERGGTLDAAAVLSDGRLQGRLSLRSVEVPGLDGPLDASLAADGPLADLPLSLEVSGTGLEEPEAYGLRLRDSFQGRATGKLARSEIRDIEGEFGPLSLNGRLELAPLRLELGYRLADLQASGRADVDIAAAAGEAGYRNGKAELSGSIDLRKLAAGGAELGPLQLRAEGSWDGEPRLSFTSAEDDGQNGEARLLGRLDEDGLDLRFQEPPLALSGRSLALSGVVRGEPGGPLTADLRVDSEQLELLVEPAEGGHRYQLLARPGLRLGPLTLDQPLEASGELDEQFSELGLQGTLSGAELQARVLRSESGLNVGGTVLSDGRRLEFSYDGYDGQWRAGGELDATTLGAALGLPITGRLEGELASRGQGYQGVVSARGEIAGIPLDLDLSGGGNSVDLKGEALTGPISWRIDGALLPDLTLQASSQHGSLTLAGGTLTGSGQLPAEIGPLKLTPQQWALQGELADSQLSVKAGASNATIDWSEGFSARADVQQPFDLYGVPGELRARVDRSSQGRSRITGEATVTGGTLELEGDLTRLGVRGNLNAPALSEALFGSPALAGVLTVDAGASLTALDELAVEFSLRSGDSLLSGDLQRQAGSWRGTLTGEGLQARFDDGRLTVAAQQARIGPFLGPSLPIAELEPVANGSLSFGPQEGWSETMEVVLERPAATLALFGAGDELVLEASLTDDDYHVRASGPIYPQLSVDLTGQALSDTILLTGAVTGTLASPRFDGQLETGQLETGPLSLGPLVLPAPALSVSADLVNGVSAQGEGVDLTVTADEVEGQVDLELLLDGEPHRLQGVVSGSPAQPVGQLEITGKVAAGSVRWQEDSLQGRVSLEASPWLSDRLSDALSEPLAPTAPLEIELSAAREGSWRASVLAPLELGETPLALSAELAGMLADYQGQLQLEANSGTLLAAKVTGNGSDWSVTADLAATEPAALSELLPAEYALRPSGTVQLSGMPLEYTVDATAEGTIAGRTVNLTVDKREGEALVAGAAGEGVSFTAEVIEDRLSFVATSQTRDSLQVEGEISWGEDLQLRLQGNLGERELRGSGRFETRSQAGELRLELGRSRLELGVSQRGNGMSVEVVADNTGEDALLLPFTAHALLTVEAGAVAADALRATFHVDDAEAATLALEGPLWPEAEATGVVEATLPPTSQPVEANVQLTGNLASPSLRLIRDGLALHAELSETGWRASLAGSGRLPGGVAVTAEELSWSQEEGFAGTAAFESPLSTFIEEEDWPSELAGLERFALSGDIRGHGGLRVRADLSEGGSQLAVTELQLTPDPWSDLHLSGGLEVTGELARVWPNYPGEVLAVTGSLDVAGTLIEPALSGPVAVAGAVDAVGSAEYRHGHASLELKGEQLSLQASRQASGEIDAEIALDEYQLGSLISEADGTTLGLLATVRSEPGARASAAIHSFSLARGGSTAVGSAGIGSGISDGINASAEIQLNLADLPLNVPLAGSLQGTLELHADAIDSLSGAALRGDLRLQEAALEGDDSSLSGSVAISGPASDPRLTLDLVASGRASGGLRAEAAPSTGRLSLETDLRWGPFSSDVEVSAVQEDVTASGKIELPGGRFLVSASGTRAGAETAGNPEGAGLVLDGQGSYRGWRLEYQPAGQRLQLAADLTSVARGARGQLSLEMGGEQGNGRWLSAQLDDVGWGPLALGDVRVESASAGAEIVLVGPALQASLSPSEGFAWTLDRLELATAETVAVTASGSGKGIQGQIEALATGELMGKELTLPVSVDLGEKVRSIIGSGTLLGGNVELAVTLEDGYWSGDVQAEGLDVGSATARISGVLAGAVDEPRLTLRGQATGPDFDLSADSTLTLAEQQLDLSIASPLLDSPLALSASRGEVWSATLSGSDGERLLLHPGSGATAEPLLSGALTVSIGPLQLALLATGPEAEAATAALGASDSQSQDPEALTPPSSAEGSPASSELLIVATVPELEGVTFTTGVRASELVQPGLLLERPLQLTGRDQVSGLLELTLSPIAADLSGVSYRSEEAVVSLNGRLGLEEPGELSGLVELSSPASAGFLPALPPGTELPFTVSTDGRSISVASTSELGTIEANYQIGSGDADLSASLHLEGGSVAGELGYSPSTGPSGSLSAEELPLALLAGQEPLRLSGEFDVDPSAITGSGLLSSPRGTLRASGTWGLSLLLPESLAPQGGTIRQLDLRLGTFDLQSLPVIARRLPHLTAPLSGFLQLQGRDVVGRLIAPDMAVADQPLPFSIDVSGSVEEVELSGVLAGSRLQLTLDSEDLDAVATLDRFPLHLLAEAATGPTDVSAELTGVARLVLPFEGNQGLVIELATELVRLERSGVVSSGTLSVVFADGELNVKEAEFGGAGQWRAEGSIRPDLLDFRLSAEDADFTPLLGLVPALARYRVGAQGSLELEAAGDFSDPLVTLTSPALQLEVAGSKYLLQNGEASLRDERLALAALVSGLSPVTGQLTVAGGGRLELQPLAFEDANFTARGAADVPGLGEVRNFQAEINSRPETGLWLEGGGELGSQFSLEGGLAPLDLRLTGEDLAVRLPQLLLASAQVDADLRMRWEEALSFSGELDVDQARFELGMRSQRSAGETRSTNSVAEQFVFDSVAIRAPGRVRFDENFGSAETSLNLTLSGTAAEPLLAGNSEVLRGTFQFSGRDFQIISGEARFDPSRGVLPLLEVEAVTTFDANRVQPTDGGFRFVTPRDGGRFPVTLAFTGEVEPAPGETPPFSLDLSPSLSSPALIQEVRADGLASGPRSLSEPELLSLITLGRLELNAPLAGQSGLATAVAEGAIDTAVDLLFVSELQSALAEALGLDVVEIRTTALSSVLAGSNSDPFSVSLRLGGYLSDEVFASYRIGSFDDVAGLYALTHEVNLLYELGPLELDLAGRVNFEDTRMATPDTELSATMRYAFDGLTSLEGGIDLSDDNQQIRFGVTLRW